MTCVCNQLYNLDDSKYEDKRMIDDVIFKHVRYDVYDMCAHNNFKRKRCVNEIKFDEFKRFTNDNKCLIVDVRLNNS